MSARDDVTLSAKERVALASLEAQARADDPSLAARLRGRCIPRIRFQLPTLTTAALVWTGLVSTVGGLALMVVTLSLGVWAGVASALVTVGGLRCVGAAWSRRFAPEPEDEPADVGNDSGN